MDERCIIFEDEEENKLEYTVCHNEYKDLTDNLWVAHLMEIDVTNEQFEQFCQTGLSTNPMLHKVLVEQLLSVDDFLIFKAMMTKRNADLYREAERRAEAGLLQDDFHETTVEDDEADLAAEVGAAALLGDEWKLYEDQLFQALEESQKDDEALARQRQREEEDMERAIALSLQAEQEQRDPDPLDPQAASSSAPVPPVPSDQPAASELPPLKPSSLGPLRPVIPRVMRVAPMNSRPGTAASVAPEAPPQAPAPAPAPEVAELDTSAPPPPPPPQPTEEERRARAEHLKRQRQLLVEKRNKERQKQLELSAVKRRPADQAVGPAAPAAPTLVQELSGEQPKPEPSAAAAAAQMRQALASQLKQTLRGV
ncbi:unnamed protein product [Effrenium voratum]|uniref:Cilia- and flagella-associated protein 36 n=1 Tax=Effrenium voratum TaxID=2562239 RepID=A0AA36JNR4_9DINO|nr:unnamed protein product [Effrenium voratum]